MEHFVLKAFDRKKSTKGYLNENRKAGRIPAVVYGAGKAANNLFVYASEYEKALKSITESTIITLDVEGKKLNVFAKDHQRHAVDKNILHIDFLEVQEGKKLHANVRLVLKGTAKGVLEGGILEHQAHDIEVECDPSVLPERIEVDVSGLEANHALHVRDLAPIKDVKFLTNPDAMIAIVKFAREEKVEEAAEAVVETETEAKTPEAPEAEAKA
ncbi:MAG: 50S ribosomal protein L25 [Spirochaetia bacterium]|jgi:large subunit ribosomal protein L25|nr:50S ribosomal protein L25 [Spirochaetales bacterium]MDX9783210.1 50S ribosomal protein L25 [Spirochaetia bacterium]